MFSAGNGPAMRAPILGAAIEDPEQLREFVSISTAMTHSDPKACYGAIAVAVAARMAGRLQAVTGREFLQEVSAMLGEGGRECTGLLVQAVESVGRGEPTSDFADSLGLKKGVSGYVYHTVPVAVHAWLSHPADYRTAVIQVIECGGDTDSTAAIVGGIVGAGVGREGIPGLWVDGLCEWPRSVRWMEQLAVQLDRCMSSGDAARPLSLPAMTLLLRNLFFLVIVLFHGFRRLLPPY